MENYLKILSHDNLFMILRQVHSPGGWVVVEKIRFSPHRKLKLKLIKCVAFWLLVFWLPNIDTFVFRFSGFFDFCVLVFSLSYFQVLKFQLLVLGVLFLAILGFQIFFGFLIFGLRICGLCFWFWHYLVQCHFSFVYQVFIYSGL